MSASEKDFVAAGAECVAGDLILNRVVVGRYRNGQYIPTEEGMLMDLQAAPAPVAEPPAPAPAAEPPAPAPAPQALKAPRKPKAVKPAPATAAAPAPATAAAPAPAPDNIDDLLTGTSLGLPE